MRSQQNLIVGPVEGYKAVNQDMTYSHNGNTFKFAMGRNNLPNDNALDLCSNGFHFCKYPSGPYVYYSNCRIFKVRAYGVLDLPIEPGADFKMVCEELEFYEEVITGGDGNTGNRNTGDRNTGDRNTGNRNTGDWNTGYWNTGYWNTGDRNTGNRNTGDRNTGDWNTGYWNTGNGNTGDRNTGDWNTGYWNTGNGNCADYHSGSLNCKEAPIYLFDNITKVKRDDIPWGLVNRLADLMLKDAEIDPTPFMSIPNATAKGIKTLHEAHIKARKK